MPVIHCLAAAALEPAIVGNGTIPAVVIGDIAVTVAAMISAIEAGIVFVSAAFLTVSPSFSHPQEPVDGSGIRRHSPPRLLGIPCNTNQGRLSVDLAR